MKVLGFCAIHYGLELLEQALRSVVDVVDKFYMVYSQQPSFGFAGALKCPDTEASIHRIAQEVLGDKLIWESYDRFGSEAEHLAMCYRQTAGYSVLLRIDADEIFVDAEEMVEHAYSGSARYYACTGFKHFFKDWEHYHMDAHCPVRLENLRRDNLNTDKIEGEVLHLGWAQNERTIRYKLSTFSHANEIVPGFWDKYLRWEPGSHETDLHPVYPEIWNQTLRYDKTQMPTYMQQHPRFNHQAQAQQDHRTRLLMIPMDYHLHEGDPGYFRDMELALGRQYNALVYDGGLEEAIQWKPSVIFFQSSMTPENCERLKRETGAYFVMWSGDAARLPAEQFFRYKNTVDLYLLPFSGAQLQTYQRLLGIPCEFIWEPIQDWRYKLNEQMDGGTVVFVGNIYGHMPGGKSRPELIETMINRGIKVEVAGTGYPDYLSFTVHSFPVRETPQLYNQAYAVLCENNYWDMDDYFTPRNLGAMAAGSCPLMREFPGIEKFFTNMQDCVYYRDELSLLEVLDFLYKHPRIRNKIAENAFKRAHDHFSMRNWADEFYRILAIRGIS